MQFYDKVDQVLHARERAMWLPLDNAGTLGSASVSTNNAEPIAALIPHRAP